MTPPDAPSAAELRAHPVVVAAFEAAWADSLADDPALRHEEGGYVYCDLTTGDISVRRALPGDQDSVSLKTPPVVPGAVLVATYHTHPNPTVDGWLPDPSPSDRKMAEERGVPFFVVTEHDVFVTGPDRRVGGLIGPSGYPQ